MTQTLVVTAGQLARKTGTTGKPSMTPDQNQSQGDHPDSQTDLQLVRKVRNGDRAAFDLLVVKYQSRVASIISRYVYDPQEVMDLAQETFVKAYRAIDRFRGDSAFYTWLYRIAVNTAKNFLESRGRRPQPSADVAEAENFDDGRRLRDPASPERLLQREQLQEALSRAIAQLPEDLRSAFLLREYDGLSYEDIARILDCPIGTVRSRIFRARDAVDRYLGPLLNPSETV
ncbi:RNA polymerase sigma factor RpoE [Marinobacter lutaoensis]|jgi:RNA polymerase sigma-70 factor (ECF subfamily)|uniref:RNA polymerase sigma factor RpoE n=1 Tax=Marinobacter lutaoensis TaxID=135739 RepID=A0A1V2DQZ5_9GAMM|nr:RNA polymerase sigma factor RpoE [Marinobacter lutaoensis]MBE02382.1 RNA polymerase sigma factor RpoE [Marinobacter sp.]MBI43011.1 RNA polymerase sigma factor RpoE [Oceanospirillales bacterium]ONF42836.1 RNA polymerase sigma factor RpoE [Marinobacter lutaoensis]